MGIVMRCGRPQCKSIMCGRCILDGSTHICVTCVLELRQARETWPKEMAGAELRQRIERFMATPPGSTEKLTGAELDAEFDRLMGGSSDDRT